jgi:hypothetical protein
MINMFFKSALVVLSLLLSVIVPASQVKAHLDPPKPPAIRVQVILKSITLNQDQDDGIDGNAEVAVAYAIAHTNHDSAAGIIEIDDFNWDDGPTRTFGPTGTIVYDHEECTPFEGVTVWFEVLEDDSDLFTIIVGTVVAVAGGIVATIYSTGTAVIWACIGGGGVFTAMGAGINGADNLGLGTASTTQPGVYTVNTWGSDGSTTIEYEVRVTATDTPGCEGEHASMIDDAVFRGVGERLEEGGAQFDKLREAIDLACAIQVEEGNPRGLSDDEIENISVEFPRRLLTEVIDPWITLIVKAGTDVAPDGAYQAQEELQLARTYTRDGYFSNAIDAYENAWSLSLMNIFERDIVECQAELAQLQKEYEEGQAYIISLESDLQEAQDTITVLESDLQECQATITVLESDLQECQDSQVSSESDLEETQASIAVLKSNLQECQASKAGLESDLKEARATITGLKSDLQEYRAGKTDVETDLEVVDSNMASLQDELTAARRATNIWRSLIPVWLVAGGAIGFVISRFIWKRKPVP